MRLGATLALGLGMAIIAGCKHENPAGIVPVADEFTVPPDEAMYNNPPTAEYKKPPQKKEWGAKPGMAGPGMSGGPSFGQ
jgi:hypothetical protein